MATGRCPGECGFEDAPARVEAHMRKCETFARAYASDPSVALIAPVTAYANAHPKPAPKPRRAPAPSAAPEPPLADDADPPGGVPESLSEGSARTKAGRRRRPQAPELTPAPDAPRLVAVEYWDTQPDLLSSLRADAAAQGG